MRLLRRLVGWLRPKMPVVNILLVIGCYLANQYFVQGFCQPVPWAAWVLAFSTGAFLAWPWLKKVPGLNYVLAFLLGGHLLVCVYCTLFIGPHLLIGVLFAFLGYPLLLWVPVLFAVQATRWIRASPLPGIRWGFGAGIAALLLVQGWALLQYREVTAAVATLPPSQRNQPESLLSVVPRNYMAERLAGQLFKYHASANMIDDGWRPPLHDPLVNVCLWANAATGYTAPLTIGGINTQAAFYQQLFPSKPIKVDCGCSAGGDGYFAWKPGKTNNWGTPLTEVKRQQEEFDAEMARLQAQADSTRAANHP